MRLLAVRPVEFYSHLRRLTASSLAFAALLAASPASAVSAFTTTRSEDPAQRLHTAVVSGIQSDTWTYDAIGNLTSKADTVNGVTDSYAFDALNRLIQISGTKTGGSGMLVTRSINYDAIGGVNSSYGYDDNGNVVSATGTIQNLGNTSAAAACKC